MTTKKRIKFYNLKSEFKTRIYKQNDFNQKNLMLATSNLKNKLIDKYIKKKNKMEKKYPIVSQL